MAHQGTPSSAASQPLCCRQGRGQREEHRVQQGCGTGSGIAGLAGAVARPPCASCAPVVPPAPLKCPSLPLRQPSPPLPPNPPPQDDILFQNLTVRETLLFAARIRLPAAVGDDAKAALVDAVISRLGLAKAAGTLVGSTEQRGVSGGERKRVNIGAWPSCSGHGRRTNRSWQHTDHRGCCRVRQLTKAARCLHLCFNAGVELLSNPSVLFLDEPSSGLDAFQAQSVMEVRWQACWRGWL